MNAVFPGFELQPWHRPEDPLQADSRHLLFLREQAGIPENLIVVDTPDIDSVAEVNWERAAHLRQIADVLIVVLTQQKYNDRAIREFFRSASEEGKLVIVIFNQCLLPEDEQYWPLWVTTFCDGTGVTPEFIYIAPNDRRKAERNQLPFYQRDWPKSDSPPNYDSAKNLMEEFSRLKFDDIKQKALSGALSFMCAPEQGIPSWLREVRTRSGEFAEALALLSTERLAEVDRWPTLPNAVLIQAVRLWWSTQREGWTATVHGVYHRLGELLVAPVHYLRHRNSPPGETPIELYRQQEWTAILDLLERCFSQLERIRDIGNPLLRAQLEQLLTGVSRGEVLQALRREHETLDIELEVQQLVQQQLQNFREESPGHYRLFRRIDTMAAAARPAISLGLFVTGAGPVGEALLPLATDAAMRGALHLAGDAIGGTVATVVGDKVLSETASQSSGYLETRFLQLHTAFSRQRGEWVSERVNRYLFQGLPEQLRQAAQVTSTAEYQEVQRLTQELQQLCDSESRETSPSSP